MTDKVKNIVWTTIVYSIVLAMFIYMFILFFRRGESVIYSLFGAIFVTISVIVCLVLLYIVWWRIFTPDGREAERIARARWESRKRNWKIEMEIEREQRRKKRY